MKVLKGKKKSRNTIIKEACEILSSNGMVVLPSDTVYGLSVDAQNPRAVDKLIVFKTRPAGKPISVFVGNLQRAKQFTTINNKQLTIINRLIPGPFTFVLDSKHKVDKRLEAEDGTLGVRIPDFDFINNLVEVFGRPITATSANLAGRSPHYSIKSLMNSLPKNKRDMIDLAINFGKLPRRKPSTVVDLTGDKIKTLRGGDKAIGDMSKKVARQESKSEVDTKRIAANLLKENLAHIKKRPLIFLIEGALGVGKTVFVKGIGEYLSVNNVISPTFVIFYEYKADKRGVKMLYHFDLYRIEEPEEFEHLGLDKVLRAGNVVCIEWGEKIGGLINKFKNKGRVVYVKMRHVGEKIRSLEVINNDQ